LSEIRMTVTANLLRLFRVDQQLRGLRTRLDAADRFLQEQQRQFDELATKATGLETQAKGAKVGIGGDESEVAGIDARIAKIRDQMNSAKTNKEYSAFLTELNGLKSQKDSCESRELEQMEKLQTIEKQLSDMASQRGERQQIVGQAKVDRDTKQAEIQGRLDELTADRVRLAGDVPKEALKVFEELVRARGDEAMANVEVLNPRDHEYTCSACMMTLPVETLNHISKGTLTRCVNCQCILFFEGELDLHKSGPKGKKKKEAEV